MEEVVLPGTEGGLWMGSRDRDKLHVIRNFLEGRLKRAQAARCLQLSERQVRKLARRVRRLGAKGVLHGLRGRPSNHSLDPFLLERALCALHDPLWHGFGPLFAQEQLAKRHRIALGVETLRQLMLQTELWQPGWRKARHRSWRDRRPCVGMLVQLDGSDHDWFEGRGPRCALVEFIDDATSRILYAEFVPVEDTFNLLRAVRAYLEQWGRPLALYVDKDSIYRVNRPATVEEELEDRPPLSQFARAMEQLGVEMIYAHSPQAKGRVERSFGTHQDRLVKELRLRGISEAAAGNRYLWEDYLPEHNRRYAVAPADAVDRHRPLLPGHDLDAILALQTPRVVQNDWTVQYRGRFFQILGGQEVRVAPKDDVLVVERLDGSIQVVAKGRCLRAEEVPGRPYRPFYHAALRSTRRPGPPPFQGQPRPQSPLPDAFKSLLFDPVLALRHKAQRDARMHGS